MDGCESWTVKKAERWRIDAFEVWCWRRLLRVHWSPREAFSSLLAVLWNSAFRWVYLSFSPSPFASPLFTATCEDSSGNHFAFLHCFSSGMVLIPASCAMSQTSVHSSSGTLLIRSNLFVTLPESICHFHSIIIMHLIWSYLNGQVVFPTFFNLSLNLAIKSSWSDHSQLLVLFLLIV